MKKLLENYKKGSIKPKMKLTAGDQLMLVVSFPDEVIVFNEETLLGYANDKSFDYENERFPRSIIC